MPDNNLSKKIRIIVDAMGGDFAPANPVIGAVRAMPDFPNTDIFLIGRTDEIKAVLKEHKLSFDESKIIHADDVIGMEDLPVKTVRQKNESSMVKGIQMVKDGKADAFISAGNTGAVTMASTFIYGRIEGVERPAIGVMMPNQTGISALFDVGSIVDAKPKHLLEYAVMGSIYVEEIFNIKSPSVGLLSIGEEKSKGNRVTHEAYELLENANINFKGHVEGQDILIGTTNVIVCDGFVGNIVIKFGKGVKGLITHLVKAYAEKSFLNKLKIAIFKNSLKSILKDISYESHGGVPLLGVNGISIIGHGSSSPAAFRTMILRATEVYQKDVINKMKIAIGNYSTRI